MKNIEVEFKFPLLNPDEVVEELDSVAEPVNHCVKQEDKYFIPAHRNFLKAKPIKEWLRIRRTDKGAQVNYKNWHGATHCDEYETSISDARALEQIFNNLNMNKVIIVKKERSTWLLNDVEVAVDYVKGLGWYIELEAKNEFNDVETAEQQLHKTLKKLGARVGEQDFKGYPHLLLEKDL